MEKRFNTHNFERFLKDAADDFRMIPSKRVWHSIYNDLHPSRKWPSIIILLLLITGVQYVGYLNDSDSVSSSNKKPASFARVIKKEQNKSRQTNTILTSDLPVPNNQNQPLVAYQTGLNKNPLLQNTGSRQNNKHKGSIVKDRSTQNGNNLDLVKTNALKIESQEDLSTSQTSPSNEITEFDEALNTTVFELTPEHNISDRLSIYNTEIKKESPDEKSLIMQVTLNNKPISGLTGKNKNLPEEQATAPNKPKIKSWKDRTSIEFYATPSIGFRKLNAGPLTDQGSLQTTTTPSNLDAQYPMQHNSALNLEAGFNMALASSKRTKIKAGLQLNLTNYNIRGNIFNHPTLTTIATVDPGNNAIDHVAASTFIGNGSPNYNTIHNTTYQLSLPIGAYYKLLDKSKFDVFVGASVQPTYVFGGNPNIISSDRKYYVNDPSFLRKWNMNTAAEAYINYKLGDINLLAGPQLRYQLFSTYNKNLAITERLYNIGFKIGLSKNF